MMRQMRWRTLVTVLAVVLGVLAAPLPGLTQAVAAEKHGGRPHPQKVWKPRAVKGLPSTHPVKGTPVHGADAAPHVTSEAPVGPSWPTASTFSVALGGGTAARSAPAAAASVPATAVPRADAAMSVAPAGVLTVASGGVKRRRPATRRAPSA